MALRGESVGTAYVRILADGDGLDHSIREQLDDLDWDKHGRKASKDWTDGWIKEIEKAPNQTKLRDSVAGPLTKGDWLTTTFFRSKNWTNFRSSLEKEFGAAGVRTGDALEKGLLEGMSMDQLNKRLGNLTPELVRQQKIINRELEDQKKKVREWEEEWHRDTNKIMVDMQRTSRVLVRELGSHDRALKQTRTSLFRFGDSFKRDFLPFFSKGAEETRPFRRRLQEADDAVDRFSDGVGTAFGRGSRNNFVNFIGSMVRNISLVTFNAIPKLLQGFLKIKDVGSEMSAAFGAKGGGLSGVISAAGVGGRAFASLAAGAAAAGVALAVISVIVGPLVAIISGLTAAVVALASSLAFAVVGGVAPLAGALLPLVAGIATVTGAILSMDKATKNQLGKSIKPLVADLKDLGRVAGKELFKDAPAQADRLAGVFKGLRPLARRLGAAMHDVGVQFIDGLTSPAFERFKRDMTSFLPGATRKLGGVFNNTFAGLGGLFRSLIPITNRFLTWLEKITGEFANWANSARGQRELKNFFKDAGDSAANLGGFLKELTRTLATLFDAGRKPGDNIFTQMTNGLKNFQRFLKEDGGKGLSDWFSNGEKTAEDVGNIINHISRLLNELDSPRNRKIGHAIFGAIAAGIDLVKIAMGGTVLGNLEKMGGALKRIGSIGTTFKNVLARAMAGALTALSGLMRGWGKMLSALGHVPGFGWAKAAGRAMQNAAGDAQDLSNEISDIPKNTKVGVHVNTTGEAALQTALNLIHSINNADGHKNVEVHTYYTYGPKKGSTAAAGKMANYAQQLTVGEAGREAIVPLDRPLGQVDPSVRWLSAFAQGKTDRMAAGGVTGAGRSVTFENAQFVSNSPDPQIAAAEWAAQIVGKAW